MVIPIQVGLWINCILIKKEIEKFKLCKCEISTDPKI